MPLSLRSPVVLLSLIPLARAEEKAADLKAAKSITQVLASSEALGILERAGITSAFPT